MPLFSSLVFNFTFVRLIINIYLFYILLRIFLITFKNLEVYSKSGISLSNAVNEIERCGTELRACIKNSARSKYFPNGGILESSIYVQ